MNAVFLVKKLLICALTSAEVDFRLAIVEAYNNKKEEPKRNYHVYGLVVAVANVTHSFAYYQNFLIFRDANFNQFWHLKNFF